MDGIWTLGERDGGKAGGRYGMDWVGGSKREICGGD